MAKTEKGHENRVNVIQFIEQKYVIDKYILVRVFFFRSQFF